MPFPIVFSEEALAASPRILATGHRTVELFAMQVSVINVALKMRLGAEALAAIGIDTSMLLRVVPRVVI